MHFPARMENGTPAHRQLSMNSAHRDERLDLRVRRDALFVAIAVVLPADDVGTSTVRVARNSFTFSSRSASALGAAGGSIDTSVTSSSRWFWTTSRSAPTSS